MKTSVSIISAALWLTQIFKQSEAILNGKEAAPGQHPYQVSVMSVDESFFCSGSIIGDTWVLTAAHCFDHYSSPVIIKTGMDRSGNLSVRIRVAIDVIVHQNYSSASIHNDIALLQVWPAFEWSTEVAPIPLANGTESSEGPARVSGWGRTSDNYWAAKPRYLRTTTVQLQTSEKCMKHKTMLSDPRRQLCTFGSTAPCKGDSGSPLTTQGVQIGIVSYGTSRDCEPLQPEVYTRVSSYYDWIREEQQQRKPQQKCSGNSEDKQGLHLSWYLVGVLCVTLLLFIGDKLHSKYSEMESGDENEAEVASQDCSQVVPV